MTADSQKTQSHQQTTLTLLQQTTIDPIPYITSVTSLNDLTSTDSSFQPHSTEKNTEQLTEQSTEQSPVTDYTKSSSKYQFITTY